MKIYQPIRFAAGFLKGNSRDELPMADYRLPIEFENSIARLTSTQNSKLKTQNYFAFTLIELLVVIAILGILAGLAVPALKNIGKGDAALSASRQMLDDIAYARQLAMSQHTTVDMIFVSTNFWGALTGTNVNTAAETNLLDKQLTGYTFAAYGAMGDQPGRHTWHYLSSWKNLPEGTFIAAQKFAIPPNQSYVINDPVSGAALFNIYGFSTNSFPFPTETSTPYVTLPYIAFNYLGQLVSDTDTQGNVRDAYIPLAKGSVSYGIDPTTKIPQLIPVTDSDVTENPPGNSTNISYNVIHIDALTGRAVLEYYKMKP